MPDNPLPPPSPPPGRITRTASAVRTTAGRHIEAVLLGIGFVLGATVAVAAGLLT